MKTFTNETYEVGQVDLTRFDRSEESQLAHWRGFTKCRQPDGTVVAVSSLYDDDGLALGPAADGIDADRLIQEFYNLARSH